MAAAVRLFLRRRLATATATPPTPASILNPSSPTTPLTSRQKTRLAISLLKSSPPPPPDQILSICRAAALSPKTHLDRVALSLATSRLSTAPDSLRDLTSSLLIPHHAHHAIVLFGQAGLLPDAISTFQSSPSTRSLNALLFACIVAGNHTEAARIFQTFPDAHRVKPNAETFNSIIKSFSESGTTRSFYSVFDEMCKQGVKPTATTFTAAIAGFYKEERFDDVEKVIKLMKKHGCGDLEEAKRLYKEMGKKGLVGDSGFYFTVIFHLCKAGDFDTALGVYNEIIPRNWVPCFSTMKMLVNGLAGSSRIDEAKGIIEKMKEKFPDRDEGWKEVEAALPQ
ncbi:unnamed protein product [Triticum turgidum subsp. durum]|uniref:Membrane-associated salt-inducible protein n=1 Tax=Triticum turgidum subsp. durum TaxID=4567 RepID=A0A9R0RRD5_TRITD|nr:unnamed protein product [Triticum turgidum subsp. durum]